MKTAVQVVSWLETVEFVVLAVVVGRIWRRDRDATSNWLAATFFTIAAVVVVSHALPQHPKGAALTVLERVLVVAIVVFPYLLYRFTLTFAPPRAPRLRRAIDVAVAALVVWTLALPKFPTAGEHRTAGFEVYMVAVVVIWVGLTMTVAVLLWRWSNGQPPVARSRMRTMSAAATGLALALLSGVGSNSAKPGPAQLAGGILVLFTAPGFLIGVAPPKPLLSHWRAQDRQRLGDATMALVQAVTPQDVADALLPRLTDFLGGSGAALVDGGGDAWATYHLAGDRLEHFRALAAGRTKDDAPVSEGAVWVRSRDGWLVIETSRFTPFFGADDMRVMESMTAIADMALGRIDYLSNERAQVEAMVDFVAIASHELRTPITTIGGFTRILQRRWDNMPDAERREAVAAISRQGVILNRLVEDLLTVSRIDAGALAPSPELLDVSSALRDIVASLALPGVELIVDSPGSVLMDPDHLRRIVSNYLRNAQVYGAPPITLEAFRHDGRVTIQVRDHGAGVPEEFRPRLFGKFARADKKTSRAIGGTGLGLSIVEGLTAAAGGEASYEPAPEGGSIFKVDLPVAVPERVTLPEQSGSEQPWINAEYSSSLRTRPTSAG